jgi:predicted transcriptional regulator
MIYVDSYDKEIISVIGKQPGINSRDLWLIAGRQASPFRKKLKRLTEVGLIIVKEIPAKESKYSYRLNNTPRKTFYVNKKRLKETVCVNNERRN